MSYVIATLILAGFLWLTLRFWDRHDFDENRFGRRQFAIWAAKGLILPLAIWMLLNFGISPHYPPLLVHIWAAKESGRQWLSAWFQLLLPTIFVVSSYWAGATFVWLIAVHLLDMETSRRDIVSAALLWCALLAPLAALVLYLGGLAAIGLATVIILIPVISEQFTLGNPRKKIIHPVYARALEKIQAGKFTAAEKEVIRQLQKSDSDFHGWLMLAELYANDLPEADRLIHQLCRQPDITREQMSHALHRLADWHLQLGRDPAAARRALEEICRAFPATHYGDVAQQRIRTLTGSIGAA